MFRFDFPESPNESGPRILGIYHKCARAVPLQVPIVMSMASIACEIHAKKTMAAPFHAKPTTVQSKTLLAPGGVLNAGGVAEVQNARVLLNDFYLSQLTENENA
jgi:hypothetical protein